ncbi:MAG: ribonuclease HII [Myxococcota bacterium]|nr:ribonuclease HII [Myxococcota bacterium]
MTDTSRESLTALRLRVAGASETGLRRLIRALRSDPRSGARALAELAGKRLERERAERRRVARLFALRRELAGRGVARVAGVDEVGVGPLAGPVVACAVVLANEVDLPGLDDSKRLTAAARERLAERIREQALAIHVAAVSVSEIDRINVLRARYESARRALAGLHLAPDHVLVDGRPIPDLGYPQTALVGGDGRDGSIAAASIVAKVHRDALMARLAARHPGYGFERHKGYATRQHLSALRRLGPSPAHRRSFAPVAQQSLL